MNKKKAQMGLGNIIMIFIIAIAGVILFLATAQELGRSVNTISVADQEITAPVDGGVYNFTGYRAVVGFSAKNTTGEEAIGSGNYTIANNQLDSDGNLVATLTVEDAEYAEEGWTLTYTAQPTGYIDSASGRGVALLIPLLFALGIAIIVLEPTLKSKLLEMMKR